MRANLGNRLWRLNNLYWIIDSEGRRVKFRLNWFQMALYAAMHYLMVVLKGRQLGVTTYFCIFALDACLFNSNLRAGIIAQTREDAQEVFQEKILYPYSQLPEALRKARPADRHSTRALRFSNNSSIRVGTSMRSGTLNILHVTEYGKIAAKYPEKAREIKTGAFNTVHAGQIIVVESTAEGNEGAFFDQVKEARDFEAGGKDPTPLDFKFVFLPWWQHPGYTLPPDGVDIPAELADYFQALKDDHGIDLSPGQRAWYVKKYQTQQDDMKREFPSHPDEAFEQAIHGAYYSKQMARARKDGRIGSVPYHDGLLVHTAWDLGFHDEMAIWFYQIAGEWIRAIDYYEATGERIEHYKQVLVDRGYLYGNHFAPHDISRDDAFYEQSRIARAAALGINFTDIPRTRNVVNDIDKCRSEFFRVMIDREKCGRGIKALSNYRKEWDERNGCYRTKPLHNWASNGADAFRCMVFAALRYPHGTSTAGLTASTAAELYNQYAPPVT